MADFDSLVDDNTSQQGIQTQAPGAGSFDSLVDDEEKYGTTEQQVKAGVEGLGRGLAGPLFTGAEKMVGIQPEAILGREKANPITAGVAEAGGLGLGFMTGTGEAAVMSGVGHLATDALGLSNLAKDASLVMKVGSSAVQQAAEMAVLQSGDETSKLLLNDPEASTEAAIANIGMAAAIGGATGGFITGAVNPLWEATAGPHVESMLNGLKEHLNGPGVALPEEVEKAITTLGINEPGEGIVNTARDRSNPQILDVADKYMTEKGLASTGEAGRNRVKVNTERGQEIAKAYEAMKHTPDDPATQKAYSALVSETVDQFQKLKEAGLKISKIEPDMKNPYSSSKDLIDDVTNNNHIWYYPTEQGFGEAGKETVNHPLLQLTQEVGPDGKPMPANDVFRIVHDYFGHVKEGVGFGPSGEENAWRQHMPMFSPEAQKALTTETRGQNSWVNFGPNGKFNQANPEKTIYAQQKAGLLPDWAMNQDKGIAPEIRAGLSKNPVAIDKFNTLKEVQHKNIIDGIEKLKKDSSESVMKSLGIPKESVEIHSDSEAGHNLLDAFKKEYNEKYQPLAEKFAQRDAEAAGIKVADEARLNAYGKMLEDGMEKMGTDSPYYKLYQEYGNRMLAKDTIGGLDKLKTEINGELKAAYREGNSNKITVLNDIKSSITNFQERQISNEGLLVTKEGMREAPNLLNDRAELNRSYSEFSKMSDELTNHLGVGDFRGAGTLESKLTNKLSSEEVLKKFSIRGNADFIKFLSENFPETLEHVRLNELKKILKPAVLAAKGEESINVKKLSDVISKGLAGQKEYIQSIIPKEALAKIDAAMTLQNAIPNPKSSGTAGWMTKVMSKLPQSAMAAIAMVTDHNPVFGYLAGEMGSRLGRQIPDAINLGYLKFLGSDQPIKASGFKAMVDFFNATQKGVKLMDKASQNVFVPGIKVLAAHQMPAKADTEKLDKLVTKYQEAPNKFMASQNTNLGHYLPNHQSAASEVSARALQYLQTIKPHPQRNGPLDREIEPTKAEQTRYQRALDIAQQPAVILQHVKDGTIKASDIQDLGAMYPGLYKTYSEKLSNEMQNHRAEDGAIPYKTRMGLSMFLGQPLDTSMKPKSIMNIQSIYTPRQPQQSQTQGHTKKGTSTLGKHNKDYRTPIQASEAQDSERK